MEFAQYLKGAVGNMEEGSENLKENLDALQYHWLFRGAFRRKAKAEKNAAEEEN